MNPLRPLLALTAGLLLPVLARAQPVAPQATVITSAGPGVMVSTDKETTITFRDQVEVTGTNMRLACDYLEVVVLRTGDQSATIGRLEKFRSMLATGHVQIVQGDREAACGRAEVLPEQDKIILSETPVIVFKAENARQAGRKITMYRGQRKVEIEEPVSTLPPVKDLGFEPPPKPAPAVAPKLP
jgi:lipopolysaccharide export system protein LptA